MPELMKALIAGDGDPAPVIWTTEPAKKLELSKLMGEPGLPNVSTASSGSFAMVNAHYCGNIGFLAWTDRIKKADQG